MSFVYHSRVRFSEVDGASIAYFSRVFEHCHAAYEELLAAAGLPLREVLDTKDWVMPLVHAEADYREPLRLGDALRIEASVERMGATSLTFLYRVLGEEGRLRAEVRLVHVVLDKASFRPRALDESLLAGLERLGLLPQETA